MWVLTNAIELGCISYKFIENSLKNKTYNIITDSDGDKDHCHIQHENIRGKECFQ